MTMARAHLIDRAVTHWYHCIARCVRRAFLLGEGPGDRLCSLSGIPASLPVVRCREGLRTITG